MKADQFGIEIDVRTIQKSEVSKSEVFQTPLNNNQLPITHYQFTKYAFINC
ncbi:hypothetical protein [Chroococcidiopsis sp. CCALA 051]|uniref:hypothetical protein n=1 Tax=Chroococcidiopsis sp. CCALA 051 TaxID=869949 RepID=UPI001304838C|nr:hypothetical protein [Chroococcidiopsis sp. CCALA 051]